VRSQPDMTIARTAPQVPLALTSRSPACRAEALVDRVLGSRVSKYLGANSSPCNHVFTPFAPYVAVFSSETQGESRQPAIQGQRTIATPIIQCLVKWTAMAQGLYQK